MLLLDEVYRLAVESLDEDRCEDLLRIEARLLLLEELWVLPELLVLRQLAELREDQTDETVVRETSVRAESSGLISLKLLSVLAERVVASDIPSSSCFSSCFASVFGSCA